MLAQKGGGSVGDVGWQELLIIFVILLLLFGATRLPALSKSLGQSVRGFRQALKEDEPAPDGSNADSAPPAPSESDADAASLTPSESDADAASLTPSEHSPES